MKQYVTSRKAEIGDKINTVRLIKTIEVEKDFNEVIDDERRLKSYIKHLEQEMIRANEELNEIIDVKTQLNITE